ncbi:MAG TPA: hypothetical protein VM141_12380 [Planctomycetota bacterium]|nr:hypothetical protein [Planctomycetota bacterium]
MYKIKLMVYGRPLYLSQHPYEPRQLVLLSRREYAKNFLSTAAAADFWSWRKAEFEGIADGPVEVVKA